MLLSLDDARDFESAEKLRRIFDAFDLKTDGGQSGGEFIDGFVRLKVIFEPGEREFHISSSSNA